MKILFHTYDLAFQRMGGGERIMIALAEAFRTLGVTVDFFDPWQHDPKDYSLVHYFSSRQSEYWSYHRKQFSTPLIVTPTLHPEPWSLRTLPGEWKQRRQFQEPHHFLPSTPREAAFLRERLGIKCDQITVVPNGIEPYIYQGDATLFFQKVGGAVIEAPVLLCIGRFQPVKNQLALVRALAEVPTALCVFIGDEDPDSPGYLRQCRETARPLQSNERRIQFWPALAHQDPLLAAAFAAADFYIMPSLFETFGIAALEAAAAGCTVIATEKMADQTILGDSALYVDPDSPAQIAAAIRIAIHEKKRVGIRRDLANRYAWPKIASQVLQIYEEVRNRAVDNRHT